GAHGRRRRPLYGGWTGACRASRVECCAPFLSACGELQRRQCCTLQAVTARSSGSPVRPWPAVTFLGRPQLSRLLSHRAGLDESLVPRERFAEQAGRLLAVGALACAPIIIGEHWPVIGVGAVGDDEFRPLLGRKTAQVGEPLF